jgi:hypothetical protein
MPKVFCYLGEVLKDTDNHPSSKRLIAFLSFILIFIGYISNLFWGYKIDPNINNSVTYIVITGIGMACAEKFSPKTPQQS